MFHFARPKSENLTHTIDSSSTSNNLWQLLKNSQTSQTSASNSISSSLGTLLSAGGNSAKTSADSSSLSSQSQLFSELQGLGPYNPTEFKKITAEIAQQLTSEAGSTTDSGQASFLRSMASNFDKASQSGNFSDLFPSDCGGASLSSLAAASYGAPPNSSSDLSGGIFSQALSQIQSDLSTTAA